MEVPINNIGMCGVVHHFAPDQSHEKTPPVYTRPADFRGWKVPDVLLSGNFAEIEKWKEAQAWERTKALRPDLLEDME